MLISSKIWLHLFLKNKICFRIFLFFFLIAMMFNFDLRNLSIFSFDASLISRISFQAFDKSETNFFFSAFQFCISLYLIFTSISFWFPISNNSFFKSSNSETIKRFSASHFPFSFRRLIFSLSNSSSTT